MKRHSVSPTERRKVCVGDPEAGSQARTDRLKDFFAEFPICPIEQVGEGKGFIHAEGPVTVVGIATGPTGGLDQSDEIPALCVGRADALQRGANQIDATDIVLGHKGDPEERVSDSQEEKGSRSLCVSPALPAAPVGWRDAREFAPPMDGTDLVMIGNLCARLDVDLYDVTPICGMVRWVRGAGWCWSVRDDDEDVSLTVIAYEGDDFHVQWWIPTPVAPTPEFSRALDGREAA